ncbi:MAG: phosphatidylglycerophosphatase A [Pseudomonadota bacterium]
MIAKLGIFLALGCGSGLLRPAPGTWGSLAAVAIAFALFQWLGHWSIMIAALTASGLGIWAANVYERNTGKSDAGEVVIDEWAGQWFALWPVAALVPNMPAFWAAAFALFRAFDILKPGPIGHLDRTLKGGLGVMADDILAGLVSAALLYGGIVVFYG